MKIFVNNSEYAIDSCMLSCLLDKISIPVQPGIALALNEKVIPKSKWPEVTVSEGDRIIIVKAVQGG
ncbi:MAG: sulfur carrier protein ThiS [Bacteroidetes bacterium]|nr:sulfur carrier protein ThiS [Bacteroidota bacterium]